MEERLIRTDYLDYIEIPIYALVEIPGCLIKPFLLFGVNTGYLLKASATYNDLGSTSPVNTLEEYKRINVALDGGAGVKYALDKNVSLLLSGQYSYGIYNIRALFSEQNTREIQILFGVLYKL